MPVYCSKHNTEMTIDQNYSAYCSECCKEALEKYMMCMYPSLVSTTTIRDYFFGDTKAYDAACIKAVSRVALGKVENNEDDDEGVL